MYYSCVKLGYSFTDKKSSDSDKKKKVIAQDDHRKEKEQKKKSKKDIEDDKSRPTSKIKDPGPSQDVSKMDISSDININGLVSGESQSTSTVIALSSGSAKERKY